MGLISDFFNSFSQSGDQVTKDIQSITRTGRPTRGPLKKPRTRRAAIQRRHMVPAVSQLSRSRQVRFINTETRRIDTAIKRESKARIPTLRDIQMAGYKYGKKNPEAARLIYGSGNFGAGIVKKAIPKDIGVPVGQAMYAFSDGAIKGVRNEPVKTLSEKFLKPKSMKPKDIKKREEKLKTWQQKDLPKWVTDFVGDPLKLSGRDRKIVLPFYGKTSAEALQQKQATTSFLNYVAKEIKTNPEKVVLFLALPPTLRVAGRGIQAAGITKLITKVPHGTLITRRAVQLVSAGLGVAYTKNMYDRVTEPIFTNYKDGKTTTTQKRLPNGDIEITTTVEQIPQFRKPTLAEQNERMGGIFATELAPLAISHKIINRGIKKGYTKPDTPKSKVKISTKIKRAGKVIKTTPAKIKTVPKKIKTKAQKAKEARAKKKRHEKLKKRHEKLKKRTMKEKVYVLEETAKGELKLVRKKRSKILEDQRKAKAKERKAIQKRLDKVEKDIKKAEAKAKNQEVLTVKKTKKGDKLEITTKAKLEKAKAKAKAKELKDIKKRHEKAAKDLKKPKIVKLSNSTYNNINKLSKLKAKLKALVTKIRNIPASIARRLGINKAQEIKKINILIRETDAVKSYIIMVQKGTSKTVIVKHLKKLPENKLQVLDIKTGNIIKKIESTTKDIELKVIKPSKKPSTEYKEVKTGDGMIQLQKVKHIQKATTKIIKITKADIKAVEKMNAEAKVILIRKAKTKAAVRIKYKQLQKVNTRIKTKQKQLLIYRQQLKENKTKLKQKQTILLTLVKIQKPVDKTRTRRIILSIPRYIELIDHVIVQITRTLEMVSVVEIAIEEIIPKPHPPITPVYKPPVKPPVVPVPKLLIPIKPSAKKKKKRKKKGVKEAFVENPIPSLKAFIG